MKSWRITNDFLRRSKCCSNIWTYRFRLYDFRTMNSIYLSQSQKKYHQSSSMFCVYDIWNKILSTIAKSTFLQMKFDLYFSTNAIRKSKRKKRKTFIAYCTLTINRISIQYDKNIRTNTIRWTKIFVSIWRTIFYSKRRNDVKYELISSCISIILQFSSTRVTMRFWKKS